MDSKKYIVGVIKDDGKRVGLALYTLAERKVEIKSLNSVLEECRTNGNIIGIKAETKLNFSVKKGIHEIKDYYKLSKHYYDIRRLPVVDCEGNVIEAGVKVCIGTIGIGKNKKYIIVDCKGAVEFLDAEQVKQQHPVGVIICEDRINIVKNCKNVYMTLEEFECNKTEEIEYEKDEGE